VLAIYLRGQQTSGSAFPTGRFDANWLTFASHLALSVQEPSSLSVVALLFWKHMIGRQIAVHSFGLPQSLQ
jgi:hypothetical protein